MSKEPPYVYSTSIGSGQQQPVLTAMQGEVTHPSCPADCVQLPLSERDCQGREYVDQGFYVGFLHWIRTPVYMLAALFPGHTGHQQPEALHPAGRNEPLRFVQVLSVSEELWQWRCALEDCQSRICRNAGSQECHQCAGRIHERPAWSLNPPCEPRVGLYSTKSACLHVGSQCLSMQAIFLR